MAIPGGVQVTGFVAPTSLVDTYPTHKAMFGHGGHRTANTIVDRDNISATRREQGMTVYVIEDKTRYKLEDGIENTNWIVDSSSGGDSGNEFFNFTTITKNLKEYPNRIDMSVEDVLTTTYDIGNGDTIVKVTDCTDPNQIVVTISGDSLTGVKLRKVLDISDDGIDISYE